MSPLAELLLALGYNVSGSDRACNAERLPKHLAALERRGLQTMPQDGSGVLPDLLGVVVSTAIEEHNPDLIAARQCQANVIHRSQLLANLVRNKTCVAVTGTAGKTTVTGMVGWIAEQAGLDPTVVTGGALLNWLRQDSTGCVRAGKSDVWILELDESDRSLLNFQPDLAIITNMSQDHFPLEEVERLFGQFAGQVKRGVIGCLGSPSNEELFAKLQPELLRDGVRFEYFGRKVSLDMLGRHNAANALQALALAERLGVDPNLAVRALASFKGVARRLEIVGRPHGIVVADDYAHNPVKIRAAWAAMSERCDRVLGIWRPHGFAPLALMADELETALAEVVRADDFFGVLPVYYAGGTAKKTMTSVDMVERLKARRINAEALAGPDAVERVVLARLAPGNGVLVMGARDPDLPGMARRIVDVIAQAGPDARCKK